VRFEECWEVAIHETADPEVIVVGYELAATVTTDRRAAAPFIGVLRVRAGQITGWREYQDAVAIAHALGQLAARAGGQCQRWPAGTYRRLVASRGRRRWAWMRHRTQ
jgi:hypothetical protein